ncbi:MAG: hypothetical protein MJ101_02530 [Clostridia bacterium]|nr:hypothetical protein [Clostridia bacterium]
MKRISAFLICVLLLVCCFAGCGNNEDTTTTTGIDPISSITPIPLSSTYDGPGITVVGGYSINEAIAGTMPQQARLVFEDAVNGYDGVGYTPLACIGQQDVAGEKYLIIAKAVGTFPGAEAHLNVLTVYKPADGKARILSSTEFVLSDYLTSTIDTTIPETGYGAIYAPDEGGMMAMPERLASAYSASFTKFTSLNLAPLACIGQQPTDGTNYALICRGSASEDGPVGIFVVEVYDSIRNGAEITSVCPVDLSKF